MPGPATADPMLQGTYQVPDEATDGAEAVRALDEFERRLSTGEVMHSPAQPRAKAQANGGQPTPVASAGTAPPMRASFEGKDKAGKAPVVPHGGGVRRLTEEEQDDRTAREEAMAEVRQLGHGDDGHDSD